MILEGTIIQVIGMQEGVSKTTGKGWKLAQYLLETNEQYPKKVCVDVFGEERINELSLIADEQVALNIDVESREFNGRWYTSVRAWGRAESEQKTDAPQVVAQPAAPVQPVVDVAEDSTALPF